MRFKSKAVGVLVAATVFAGGTSIAVSSSGALSSVDPEPETPTVAAPTPAARATFSIISDAPAKAKGAHKLAELNAIELKLPNASKSTEKRRSETGDRIVSDLGARKADVALARGVGKLDILVTPGSGGLCLITTGPLGSSAGCDSEEGAAKGGGFTVGGCLNQGDFSIVGLVPNGPKSVTLTGRSGASVSADVINNVAGFTVPPNTKADDIPVSVTWKSEGGEVSAPLPTPSDPNC